MWWYGVGGSRTHELPTRRDAWDAVLLRQLRMGWIGAEQSRCRFMEQRLVGCGCT